MIKMKSLAFISLLLTLCISLGAVSATDIYVNDTNCVDNTQNMEYGINELSNADNIQNMKISQEDSSQKNSEITNLQANPTPLSELNEDINDADPGDTISLTQDYKGEEDDGIVIDKSLTIDGQGHTIDGSNSTFIFRVSADNVILKNINFINTKSANRGGAIYWANGANGVVSSCNFTNCAAREGGAIHWYKGANGVVSSCNFINCKVDEHGGAIYRNKGAINVSGCSFVNCFANRLGGAIYWDSGDDGDMSGCSFIDCSAEDGGAIYCVVTGNVSGCSFVNCSANHDGGAIYWQSNGKCNYNIFDNNVADDGDAIYTVNAINCDFNFFSFENNVSSFPNDLVYGSTVVNWVVLNISKDNSKYSVDFVCKDGSILTKSMHEYTAKLDFDEDIEITIKNNTFKGAGVNCDYLLTSPNSDNVLARTTLNWNTTDYNITTSDCVCGENATVTVKVNDSATGNITVVLVNGSNFTKMINGGVVNFSLSNLSVGVHNLNISYSGDNNYLSFTATANLTVNKLNTTVSVSIKDINYGDDATVNGSVNDMNGDVVSVGNVTLFVDGVENVTVMVNDGNFSIDLHDLSVGVYNITIVYNGEGNYSSSNATANLTVNNATGSFNIGVGDIVYGDGFIINITNATGVNGVLLNGTVDVTVDGKVYSFNVTDGKGSKKVSDILPAGKYVVNASLSVPNYDVIINSTSFTIAKVPTKFIDATKGTIYNGKYYSVRLVDNSGNAIASKNIIINIAGKTYTVKTDKNGLAKIKLALTNKYIGKSLTVTYKFNGDNTLKESSESSKIKVIKTSTKLTNVSKRVIKNHKYFYVKLKTKSAKIIANKVITMKSYISGKTYKIKTNSKGIAKIDLWVKKQRLGKYYKYVFKYAGNNYYSSCTKTFKIKIVK